MQRFERFTALPLATCLLLAACGGSGGGGGSSEVLVEFSQTSSCTGNEPNLVSLDLGQVDAAAQTFQLVVEATLSDPTLGVAFHVAFDPAVLAFQQFVPEPTFLAGGVAAAQPLEGATGVVAVGLSRLGGAQGATGAVTLGRLVFRRKTDSGLSSIAFSDELLASSASGSLPVANAGCWSGGQVRLTKK